MNLLQHFLDATTDHRDKPFLSVPGGPTLSFADTFDAAAALAGALVAEGFEPGDRLVAQVAKSTDAFALYLACLQAGVVYTPLNTAYTPNEVSYFVEDTGARLFVDDDELARLCASDARPLDHVVERDDDDLACMLYTSGTTGRSKGAMLTHRNLEHNGRALHQVWAFEPGDVLLHILPIFHVHGLFVALHCALLNASEVIYCLSFDVATVRAELPRATVMMGVPTHYTRLLADPEFGAADCRSIRVFTAGSAPLTEIVFREFTDRTGHVICERYGMTECGIITSNPYDGDRIAGTVGYPLPGVEIKVVDDQGDPCPAGENGMVWVRGDSLGPGYWQLPEKTAEERDADGYFRTGDVGFLDETGRLSLAGRAGDMIISGGYNVYPKEIELVLDEVPGVIESAVVGLPHPDFGEGVVAFIVGAAPAHTLAAACESELARFKHPKRFVTVDELPRNAMGKVQKAQLRQANQKLLMGPGTQK